MISGGAAPPRTDPADDWRWRVALSPVRRGMLGGMTAPRVIPVEVPDVEESPDPDRPWVTIVWNDPVNLMSYVTWVFQKLFGYSREKA